MRYVKDTRTKKSVTPVLTKWLTFLSYIRFFIRWSNIYKISNCSTSILDIEWTLVLPHPPSQNIRILQELEHVCITAQNRFLSGILTIINFGRVTRDQDTKPRRKNSFSLKLTNSLDSDLSPESL